MRKALASMAAGVFAQAVEDMLDKLELVREQARGHLAGRTAELLEEDDEGNPATAHAKP